MRKLIFLSTGLFLLLGFAAGHAVDATIANLLQQFQTSEEDAKSDIFYAVTDSSSFIPNVKSLRHKSTQERVDTVEMTGKYLKEYLASDEFLERYNQYREGKKPTAPESPQYSTQLKDEQRKILKKNIAEIEKNKTQMAQEQQAIFAEVIKGLQQQLTDLDDPEKTMYTPEMDSYIKNSYDTQVIEYNQKVVDWENAYPEDNPKPMIQNWLAAFLEESAGVNFAAETTGVKDGIVKFVDQEYEQKDKRWKLYFRAGKGTVDAARAFAQAWLEELK